MRICIVGNGVAGIEAARVLRQTDPHARITLISEESDHFFSRPALMWMASGQLSLLQAEPLGRRGYASLALERVRARAMGLDVRERCVRLAGGLEPLSYDRLLIAAGSRPRPAPFSGGELVGVGHFVTLQDLGWLMAELGVPSAAVTPPRALHHLDYTTPLSPYRPRPVAAKRRGRPARSVAVLGGGLVGLEVAEICASFGVQVHFFSKQAWFWPLCLEPRESAFVVERLRQHGILVHFESEVRELMGSSDGLVRGVSHASGEVACDAAVVAIGVEPNVDWLDGAGLSLENGGLAVDAGLQTSAADVFAAGDCAATLDLDGARRTEPLWYAARAQGRVAGRRLGGQQARYERMPFYNSAKLIDLELTTCGLVNRRVEGERNWFYEEREAVRSTTRIVTNGHHIVGFNGLGRRWDSEVLLRFMRERRSLTYVLEHLHEAAFDTELTPPLRVPQGDPERLLGGPVPSPVATPIAYPEHW